MSPTSYQTAPPRVTVWLGRTAAKRRDYLDRSASRQGPLQRLGDGGYSARGWRESQGSDDARRSTLIGGGHCLLGDAIVGFGDVNLARPASPLTSAMPFWLRRRHLRLRRCQFRLDDVTFPSDDANFASAASSFAWAMRIWLGRRHRRHWRRQFGFGDVIVDVRNVNLASAVSSLHLGSS